MNVNFGKKIVCDSCLFKIASPLQTLWVGLHLRRRLGCALGSWKRQQICRSTESSSIGSCGIGCCGGGGSVGATAAGCAVTVRGSRVQPEGQEVCSGATRSPVCPCGSALPTHNNQTAKQRPQKLLWRLCRLSAAAVATGGSSGASNSASSSGSCSGIGCVSAGRSVSVSGNCGGGGGGSRQQWPQWQWRWKWRQQ